MENPRKLSLRKEIEQEAEQIEKEIEKHPELEKIKVTEEMDAALLSKICEYEKEKTAEKKGNVRKKTRWRMRWFIAVAAVLVLIVGVGMTSIGSKSYWKEFFDVLLGEESARVIDVEDMEKKESKDTEEMKIYQEIAKKIGYTPVWMRYKPQMMIIENYEMDEELGIARVFYKYNDEIVRYTIYSNDKDSSWAEKEEDIIVNQYTIEIDGIDIEVDEIRKPNQPLEIRVARFEYKEIYYELKGMVEAEEFNKILENLYFI